MGGDLLGLFASSFTLGEESGQQDFRSTGTREKCSYLVTAGHGGELIFLDGSIYVGRLDVKEGGRESTKSGRASMSGLGFQPHDKSRGILDVLRCRVL